LEKKARLEEKSAGVEENVLGGTFLKNGKIHSNQQKSTNLSHGQAVTSRNNAVKSPP